MESPIFWAKRWIVPLLFFYEYGFGIKIIREGWYAITKKQKNKNKAHRSKNNRRKQMR